MKPTQRVFLYGTLRAPEMLAAVLGHTAAETAPDTLPGYKVVWNADKSDPVLVQATDAEAQGLVLDASPADIVRLDWFEGAFGYDRTVVELSDGPAHVYTTPHGEASGEAWTLEAWLEQDAALELDAVIETMRLFPDTPMQDVAQGFQMRMARAASRARANAQGALSGVRKGAGRKGVTVNRLRVRHRGFFALDELDLTHRRFDGDVQQITREVFLSTDATLVLPYDPARDQVVLVEQFRAGPFRRGEPVPWCLEPVAGLIDPGETPEDCAHREAQEEAGLRFDSLVPVPSGYPSPGATAEYYHLFLGLCDLSEYRPVRAGLASEGEDILTHVLSLDAALGLLETGEANVLPLAYLLTWTAAYRAKRATH